MKKRFRLFTANSWNRSSFFPAVAAWVIGQRLAVEVLDAADVEACHALLALDDAFNETGAELREPVSFSMLTNIIGRPRRYGPGGILKERKATAALWKERWDRCGGYDF